MKIMRECFNPAAGSDSLIGECLIEGFSEGRDQEINGYLVHNVPEYAGQYNYIVARYIPDKDEFWFWGAWKDEKPALEAARDIDGQVIYRNGYKEGLEEAKKEEDELPPDPGAVKVEVHNTLNNLVADEIEAIDGYEKAKAGIIEQPIEHKDEIISTIDHIKDEEKEHIDELINATSEIPFSSETKTSTEINSREEQNTDEAEEFVDEDEWEDEDELTEYLVKGLQEHINDRPDPIEDINTDNYETVKSFMVDIFNNDEDLADPKDYAREKHQYYADNLDEFFDLLADGFFDDYEDAGAINNIDREELKTLLLKYFKEFGYLNEPLTEESNDEWEDGVEESLTEGMFDQAFYNTQEIIDNTTGKNKSFISRIAKHQEEKYGNVDIFDASLEYGEVSIGFGDYSLTFFFDNEGNIKDVIGNGQGSKYQSSLEDVAKELYKKFGIENGF